MAVDHALTPAPAAAHMPGDAKTASKRGWWRDVSGYQWLVFALTAGAWLFDNLDQRLFSLARIPALTDLMLRTTSALDVQAYAKLATALFLIGWGIGGLTFGALGDRYGRVRLLTLSILLYSICTGLTAICASAEQFAILRFATGVGIGGIFGLAVAILAESVSGAARLAMLALLQLASTIGNIGAALVKMGVDAIATSGAADPAHTWRWLFAIGMLPALLAVCCGFLLKESPAWLQLKADDALPKGWFGAYEDLFVNRAARRNLVIGSLLAITGVVGLWGIGEYAVDLQHAVFTAYFAARLPAGEVAAHVANAKNWSYLLQMGGGAVGMLIFTFIAHRWGRRPAFVAGFSAALVATVFVYWRLETPMQALWMMPLMGAAQLGLFAGFSIYLPELFGARSRGTGVSFAYNLGRFAAAGGSYLSAMLTTRVFSAYPSPAPLRYSAMALSAVFIVGLVAAALAPETRGRPLPE
jgi:MFS family permease